ncbi:MAG: alpha/beta fold hydrolase [Ilumatobacteraceae bacterium]
MVKIVQPPVLLLHGWGSSFTDTWEATGITSLLEDAHRECIGVDLLGHGTAPKSHDPNDYRDLGARVRDALPHIPVDAVGFSLGALVLLQELVRNPQRFHRVVLVGIGDGIFEETQDSDHQRILAGLFGTAPDDDNIARLFGQYANRGSNDIEALAAVINRPRSMPFVESDFCDIDNAVLVVVGDRDFVFPASRLAHGFPNGSLKVLNNTDHFKTPESFQFIDAMLEFLGA